MNKQQEKDIGEFMKDFLTKSHKTDLGVPKRPNKNELATKHKIVKGVNGFKLVKVE